MAKTEIAPLPTAGTLPAYLNKYKANFAAFYAGVAPAFPVLSILGKNFTLVRGGERQLIPDPNDPAEPARALNVVLIDANPVITKVFYGKKYEPGSAEKPWCYSNDGVKPAADADDPQATSCAACPHNVFGTSQTGKGKACQDNRRVAVAPAGNVNEAMLLRVPPTSLRTLAEYAESVMLRGVPMHAVVTKIRFDPEQESPKLLFRAEGILPEAAFDIAEQMRGSELVRAIVGVPAGTAPSAATPPVREEVSPEAVSDALQGAAAAEPKPAPKSAPKPAPKSEPKPEPKPEPKAAPSATDPLAAKIDAMLSSSLFDD